MASSRKFGHSSPSPGGRNNSMAIVRDIISHVTIEVAARVRICHHNRRKHSIPRGHACMVIHGHDGGKKNYCSICAKEILSKAKVRLLELDSALPS